MNFSKCKQLQYMLEDAEERADIAENSLTKVFVEYFIYC